MSEILKERARVSALLEAFEQADRAFQAADKAYWLQKGCTIDGIYPEALREMADASQDALDALRDETPSLARSLIATLDALAAAQARVRALETVVSRVEALEDRWSTSLGWAGLGIILGMERRRDHKAKRRCQFELKTALAGGES